MTTTLTEIAPDLFRISTYVPEAGIQFNQFLIRDDEPLLFETGYRSMFEIVREQVARVIDPTKIRWIGFSHFEGDECGALNEWLQVAPAAQAVCATHHGSAFVGDGQQALRDLVAAIKEVGRWLEVPGPKADSAEDIKGAPDALPSDEIDLGKG